MFEFHGWITVRVAEDDEEDLSQTAVREEAAMEVVRRIIADEDDNVSFFDLRRTSNSLIVLSTHGLRNHRYQPVIDLFRQVAERLPDSYGLLYVYDDERRPHDNEFRVWRLASGELTEHADPFLSPYVPTVELPYSNPGPH
jgi:hypothetical protein